MYKAKKTYADGTQHIVYYIKADKNIPCSLGWDNKELSKIVSEKRDLSVFVKLNN